MKRELIPEVMAYRNFKKASRFRLFDKEKYTDDSGSHEISLAIGERVIASYCDHGSKERVELLFTTLGIRILKEKEVSTLSFSEIREIQAPESKAAVADEIIVLTKHKILHHIPVTGFDDMGRDIFLVYQYLSRVMRLLSS